MEPGGATTRRYPIAKHVRETVLVGPRRRGMRVTTGPRLTGPGSVLECTQLGLAGAVGDGLERSLGLQEMVAFDSLGAPFWRHLGEHVRQPAASATHARLRSLLADGPVAGWPGAQDSPFVLVIPARRHSRRTLRARPAQGGQLALAGGASALRHGGTGNLRFSAFSRSGTKGALPVAGAALT